MSRITCITDQQIDELRARYRSTGSVSDLVRHIVLSGMDRTLGQPQLVLMDVFHLKLSQVRAFMIWLDKPELQRINGFLSDQELDKRMRTEIESTRSLWDKPATENDD